MDKNSLGIPPLRGTDIRRYGKSKWGWCPTPPYLKRTYLESTSVHSSPLSATKRRVEVLGYVEFTELLGNRKSRNGGLLIHMSQVRALPGEPVL